MDSRSPSPVESEYTDLEPHELWGKHKRPIEFVMEYKKLFNDHIGDWKPKSVEELDRCISMVRENKDKVSISELETMVRSARTWQLFEHFTRDSLDLIPHFMELLRSYCEENWLFDRYYGFLCFQLLTYIMIAGIINNFDEREHAYSEIRRRSVGTLDIACNIAGCGTAMLLGQVQSRPGHLEERFSTLFVTSYLEGEYVLLPGLGGFREKDALWLLDELWEIRRPFLPLCAGVFGTLPGWAVLFTAMWRCIKRTNSAVLLKKLRNLLLRYSLVTIEPELGVVCVIVSEIEEQIPSSAIGNEELPPVDVHDVKLMVRLFQAYLKSEKHHRSPGDMFCFPFAMVYHNALTAAPDQVSPLLVAVTECVWETLGKADSELALRKRMLEAFHYGVNSMVSMCSVLTQYDRIQKSRRATTAIWTRLLRDANILELIGRLCSIAVVSSGEGLLISHGKFKDLAKSTSQFMESLKGVTQIHELRGLDDLRHTWDKVLRYIDIQLSIYPPDGPIQHRIREMQEPDMSVCSVVGCTTAPDAANRCIGIRLWFAHINEHAWV